VQQVANLLNKDSILITQGQAAAQALYAVAVGTSTGAMKAFRIALLATGIGAAVAAVGLLVAKWDELTAAVRRFLNLPDLKQRAAEQAIALQREEAQLEQYRQAYDRHTDSLIAADNKRKAQQEQRRKEQEEATKQRLLKLQEENNAIIKFVEDLNLTLYEMKLDAQAAEDQAVIDGMRKQSQARASAAARDIEIEKKKLEDQKIIEQQKVELASSGFATIGQLANAFAGQSEQSQRKAFNVNKAAGMAQAIIDTYAAAQGAYKSQMTIPDPSAPVRAAVAAGIAIAQGLARVAAISKTQFSSTSSTTPPPSGGATSTTPPATFSNPQTTMLGTDGAAMNGQGQGMQPMRAYVVERDIQQTTSRVRRLSEFATLG
jgi:hypothetical protein